MNRHRNAREPELSLLAKGRGLMDGGVELECFADDRRSFTLNGESFIRPSTSPEGQQAKPYRRFQLMLPKTYVTRRGQMVLFTSPGDMIVGQSVTLQHRKEVTSATAARRLKTVNKLVSSSMDYEPTKSKSSEVGEFTPVYLQRLREAAERAKEAENYEAQGLDKDENMEEDDLEAADSGVGPSLRPSSSGRLSSLSHYSDGTVIQIPGERLMEEREDLTVSPTDPFKLLAGELGGHMASGQKVKTKPSGGKSTKKRKATSDMTTTAQKQKPSKTKGKKRKRGKKPTQKDSTDGGGVSHGSSKVNVLRDLESKRREKRELERQREEQARERARLEDELRKLRESKTEGESEVSDEGASEGGGRRGRGECVAMARGGIKADMEHKRNDEDTCHRKRDSTEGHRRKLTEAERAARAREAYEKGAKLREKSNYNNHRELQSLRLSQSITPAYTFSYFQHVPPRGDENSSSGGTAKGSRRGQQSKKQRQPKK